jgi:protein-L-isoaspartate(D-aspartate) O-methyltransferase
MLSFRIAIGCLAAALLAQSNRASAQFRADFEEARKRMVTEVCFAGGVRNERVLDAMRDTPRHEFVDLKYRKNAYFDMALPIGDRQTISSPLIVSMMTEALDPQPDDTVLEIGTGSGYQAAVLSPLVKEVYSIEIVRELGEKAERTLKRLGYKNVFTRVGDGYKGWPEHAPFDKIIVTCSPEKVPEPLAEQLAEGGLMVIPVGERYHQIVYKVRKKDGKLEREALVPTIFVPMTGRAEELREVKPDPANPEVVNGGFEKEALPSGGQHGWYYEMRAERVLDAAAPEGSHCLRFRSSEPGLQTRLLQGFAIDGRKVNEVELSAYVKLDHVAPGPAPEDKAMIAVTFFDDERREIGHHILGPFTGSRDWHEEKKKIVVPNKAREGILRLGMFGATGEMDVDRVQIRKLGR